MINVKSKSELEKMRKAGIITGNALHYGGQSIKVGMSTYELDKLIHDYIVKNGAKPSFLGYGGFPGSACISINDQVIHGIPSKKKIIHDGDIVSIDVGAYIDGFHGDSAYTFPVGNVSPETLELLKVTKESLYLGIEQAVVGNRIGDIGHAIEEHNVSHGYGVVKQYIGHGVGRDLHESPEVPNYGREGHGPRLVAGMTIAIEPMINAVGEGVKVLPDGWTVLTKSGSPSAHFEHTIAVTPDGPVILTKPTIV
ncbi:MAG: type I methionyl aminopeptidase [Oscillospiraceae bacterium]